MTFDQAANHGGDEVTKDESDQIDALLYDWYQWSKGYQPPIGYGAADSTCRGFSISRQWMEYEELSEEVDYMLRESTGKIVEPMVFALSPRHRIAVQTAMRNMEAGRAVWKNPRNPETQDSDFGDAKMQLLPKFRAKGLLKVVEKPKVAA